jgi:hypothetical protein
MTEQIKDYQIELHRDLIIIRKAGETIKAKAVKPSDAFQKFQMVVESLKEKLL